MGVGGFDNRRLKGGVDGLVGAVCAPTACSYQELAWDGGRLVGGCKGGSAVAARAVAAQTARDDDVTVVVGDAAPVA